MQVAETGLEEVPETRGKTHSAGEAAHNAAQLVANGDHGLAELVSLWESLDDAGRADLVAYGRSLVDDRLQG